MQPYDSKDFHVYMIASGRRGVSYVGMSSDLPQSGVGASRVRRQRFHDKIVGRRLVYYERRIDADSARHREYLMKRWRRDWKIELIERHNPIWSDLFEQLVREAGYA